jgi:hypothetical protein
VSMNYGTGLVQATFKSNRVEASTYTTIDTMTITRSGRVCAPPNPSKPEKGKEKVVVEENIPTNLLTKEPPSEKEVEEFLELIKNNEFDIVNQLHRTPAKISLLALIYYSKAHRDVLLKILRESHISKEVSVSEFEGLISHIQAPNYLTFSDDELGPDGRGHIRPLNITVRYEDLNIYKVLIDNGSCFNVMPKSTYEQLPINRSYTRPSHIVAKAFNGTKVRSEGQLELPILVGPNIFHIDFQIIDTRSQSSSWETMDPFGRSCSVLSAPEIEIYL